jgi:hypothetical protein
LQADRSARTLYEQAYYRKPVTWKKVDRFVPDHAIVW